MDELKELDMVAEECHFCEANLIRRDEVSSELERVILLEEKVKRQKSSAHWLKEGDKNTFH